MDVPKSFRKVGLHRVEIREGGGCISLFGLPFLAAGLFMLGIGFGVIAMENASPLPRFAMLVVVGMGLVFTAVGGGLAFGRRWTVLDMSRRKVIRQQGLLIPMTREELSLGRYGAVMLTFDEGDSDTPDRYPVMLRAAGGIEDLKLHSPRTYPEALEQAGFLAAFLTLPLVDASTDHISLVEPDRATVPLPERLAREEAEEVGRPHPMRSTVEETRDGVRITIPAPPFRRIMLLPAIVPLAILLWVVPRALRFFESTSTPDGVQIAVFGFLFLFFVIGPLLSMLPLILGTSRGRTTVIASPSGMEIEERGMIRHQTTLLSAEEIVGLDYSTWETARSLAARRASRRLASRRGGAASTEFPAWLERLTRFVQSKGITVKSTRGLFTIGAGLPDEEVHYLESVLQRALTRSS